MRKFLYTLVALLGVAAGWFAGSSMANLGNTNNSTDLQTQLTQKEAQITELQESVNNYQTQLSHYTQDQELTNDLILDGLVAMNIGGGMSKETLQQRLNNNDAIITINPDHSAIFRDQGLDHPIYIKLVRNNLLITTDTSNNAIPDISVYDTITRTITTVNFNTLQQQVLNQATQTNP